MLIETTATCRHIVRICWRDAGRHAPFASTHDFAVYDPACWRAQAHCNNGDQAHVRNAWLAWEITVKDGRKINNQTWLPRSPKISVTRLAEEKKRST